MEIKELLEQYDRTSQEGQYSAHDRTAKDIVWKLRSVMSDARLAELVEAGPDRVVVGVRKDVAAFALAMEATLKKHDDRPGWEDESWDYLNERLEDEIEEMRDVNKKIFYEPGEFRKAYCHELIDIANFCMMIYCNEQREAEADAALAALKGEGQ